MISLRNFGITNSGEEAHIFILENGKMSVYITDFGGHIVAINVPDNNGILTDVVLGADNISAYEGDNGYMGATIGRFANRIENGKFILNRKEYALAINDGPNHLHGGEKGFNHKMFTPTIEDESLVLTYSSPDGEEGYPGNLTLSVKFTLCENNELVIEYFAESDKDTIVNFTNHAYFNLNGALSEKTIHNHTLKIDADAFCRCDDNCLANGMIVPVRDTDMDFRKPAQLAERLTSEYPDIKHTNGIDHNFVLNKKANEYKCVAELYNKENGIFMECFTDQTGVQIYTGNTTDIACGKCGTHYGKHSAICLETQGFPNSTTFRHFPSPVLKAGDKFYSKTAYAFSLR